ncbi:hypothetical protein [Bradyrhizobium japonicum]|uniref:hypothetical protein n=1 Tax=Bradyrhizobium japonicum TaxID=375 RepID=UPI001BA82FDC|nr:hypothetical protein [Bradyrhizobium japonicum]MBR0960061.1 hypothetical protein [Bradyrhizobium japonicum]
MSKAAIGTIFTRPFRSNRPAHAARRLIEIEFAAGARMQITGMVDAATLKAAVAALADGRLR